MTDLRQAAQQALESWDSPLGMKDLCVAMDALRKALEQPEQGPVAKVVSTAPDKIWLDLGFDPQDEAEIIFDDLHDVTWSADNASGNGIEYVRATQPAAQREWQGLTDEDVNRESAPIAQQMKLAFHAGMYVAQKILKERNT